MKLTFIVVYHNMKREIARTLMSLKKEYQLDSEEIDYEVIVVDNGSSELLMPEEVKQAGDYFFFSSMQPSHPSPAHAINRAAELATGDVLCIMVDGATILSPGVVSLTHKCFKSHKNPVVALRYFFLGYKEQNLSIAEGYTKSIEDDLLSSINWPNDGYRLFEISTPMRFPDQKMVKWTDKMIESNCLCMLKSTFDELGGCEPLFDFPGGGFMNIDLYQRAAELPNTTLILLIGEGVFHQLHGGTTTNVDPAIRDSRVSDYRTQYEEIRGQPLKPVNTEYFFFGHYPNDASKIHRKKFEYTA